MDERRAVSCCQWADDEALADTVFDCATCPVAQAIERLQPENAAAWQLYHRIAQRVLVDIGLTAAVFARLTADLEADDLADLVDRLALIDDVLRPVRVETVP